MAPVTMRQLLEAGVHFGHQTRRWNPKMRPYIFTERNGVHIVDLRQTLAAIEAVYETISDVVADGGRILFVGTKKQAQAAIEEQARRAGMPWVNHRWLGGMLTNFQTIHKRILYMRELEQMESSGEMESLPKKERLRLRRELAKLETVLGGVRDLQRPPEMVFIIDVNAEAIAVKEANRLGIPIVAVVDTNCDPDPLDYVIPGNDDAIRAAQLMTRLIADACLAGKGTLQEVREGVDEEIAESAIPESVSEIAGAGTPTSEQRPEVIFLETEEELAMKAAEEGSDQ